MKRFHIYKQHDSMKCGATCLKMICKYWGQYFSDDFISEICKESREGVSIFTISNSALRLGMEAECGLAEIEELLEICLPCILHWNQNHFVVLYKIKKGRKFYIADPGKGCVTYTLDDFKRHWISTKNDGKETGVALFIKPTPKFYSLNMGNDDNAKDRRSFRYLAGYVRKYRRQFALIVLGMIVGSGLQLVLPFLTQSIVDVGIRNKDIGFVWLVLLGQLMLTISRTAIDFIRRWLLLRISMRVNISLVNDFFIKLLRLPMSFFDTKLMGDLMQRMGDHDRVNSFLTGQALTVTFSMLTFIVFSAVLFIYN